MSQPAPLRFPVAFLTELAARVNLAELVGRAVQLRREGRHSKGLCPFHAERNPSFAVYDNGYHCFGCGASGDAIEFVMATQRASFVDAVRFLAAGLGLELPGGVRNHGITLAPPRVVQPLDAPAPHEDDANRERAALRLYLEARPGLADTPADLYLRGRDIDLRQLGRQPRALRFHPACYCAELDRPLPALIAAITNADGRHVATHRTWLAECHGTWGKAPLRAAKKCLGMMRGGTIRLRRGVSNKPLRDAPEGDPVAIGEGIETCLSVAVACPELRVICGVSLSNMASVDLPPQMGRVLILADNDGGNAAAAGALQRVVNRFTARHADVRLARAPIGKDFNDCLRVG